MLVTALSSGVADRKTACPWLAVRLAMRKKVAPSTLADNINPSDMRTPISREIEIVSAKNSNFTYRSHRVDLDR
jgi:hypothetical protein